MPIWKNNEEPILWSRHDNVIYQTSSGYWFVDECWMDSFGPFATYGEAVDSLNKYCKWLDSGEGVEK